MNRKRLGIIISCIVLALQLNAQDVQCNFVVTAQAINGVDAKVFKSLQQSLMDFVNQRKWTNDEFGPTEKIVINFNLNVTNKIIDIENGFEGKLSIQSSRPVYGTDYSSTLVNYADNEVRFKYLQFAPIDFNENRVSGNDAVTSNLPAIVAYYVYLAIGMDYDSYKFKGGQDYYTKAQNIVLNAPEGNGIAGWSQNNDKQKNRFWLINNILNPRFLKFRENMYNYHRKGLDKYSADPTAAMKQIQESIEDLNQVNIENPASAIFFLYFSAKNTEYLNFLKKMPRADREKYGLMLSMMDIPNSQTYLAAKQ